MVPLSSYREVFGWHIAPRRSSRSEHPSCGFVDAAAGTLKTCNHHEFAHRACFVGTTCEKAIDTCLSSRSWTSGKAARIPSREDSDASHACSRHTCGPAGCCRRSLVSVSHGRTWSLPGSDVAANHRWSLEYCDRLRFVEDQRIRDSASSDPRRARPIDCSWFLWFPYQAIERYSVGTSLLDDRHGQSILLLTLSMLRLAP